MAINQQLLKNLETEWHLHVTNMFSTVAALGGLQGYSAGINRPGGPMGLQTQTAGRAVRRRIRPSRARTTAVASR
jgi:hypothetical protein